MTKGKGRVLQVAAALSVTLVFGFMFAGGLPVSAANGVLAGSPSNFESGDGNMTVQVTGATGDSDWNCFVGGPGFVQTGVTKPTCNSSLNPASATQQTADAGGEVKLTSGTKFNDQCPATSSQSTPAKDDFTNIAEYTEFASNNDVWFYGAAIRATANGNSSGNVEFNQGSTGCRVAGDKLLAYEFLNGGTSLSLHVLTWIASSAGGSCFSGTTFPCWRDDGAVPATDPFNGEANQAAIAASDNGINGQSEAINQFFEFGSDLTKVLGLTGCSNFQRNVFESRSSGSSFTSNPEDVEVESHPINNCSSSTKTTPENSSGTAITSISIGGGSVKVEDKALVTVGGTATFGGSVTFHLCAPSDLTAQTTCATGGTLIGAAKAVSPPSPVTVTSDQATITLTGKYCWRADYSGDTANGIPTSSDSAASECFTVTPVSPSLTTTLHDSTAGTSQVGTTPATALGASIGDTVYDTASLTGAATGPAGKATISYAFYTDSACSLNAVSETPSPNTFTSGGTIPQSNSFTFLNAGTYYWQAVYSGDANNNLATSPCNEVLVVAPNTPTFATTLHDSTAGTSQAGTTPPTNLSANIGDVVFDTATLTGAAAGPSNAASVTYAFYTDSSCTQNKVNETPVSNTFTTGGAIPQSKSFTFLNAGTYYWQAVYSGDANNSAATSPCNEVLVVGPNSPTLSTTLHDSTAGTTQAGTTPIVNLNASIGDHVFDTASLSGAAAGPAGAATISYAFYTDSACSLNAVSETPSPNTFTTGGTIPRSTAFTFLNAGTYYWQAVYSGDQNNNPATSSCNEVLVVAPNSPTLATTLHDNTAGTSQAGTTPPTNLTANIGDHVFDTASLSGAAAGPAGAASISYAFYTDSSCSLNAVNETPSANTFTTAAGAASAIPQSKSFTFQNAGTYYWQAVYSGDNNNIGATSPCNEVLVVAPNSPTLSTTLHDSTAGTSQVGTTPATSLSASIGDQVYDTARLSGAAAGPAGAATITYAFYTDSSCTLNSVSETPSPNIFTSPGPIPQSNTFTFLNAGTYYWQAVYSGDSNNNPATSPCNEVLVVAPNSPALTTTLQNSTAGTSQAGTTPPTNLNAQIGDVVYDTATLSGAAAGPSGAATISYAFYTDSSCSLNVVSETPSPSTFTTAAGSASVIPQSNSFTFLNAGTYYWQAVYSGDNNNIGATSPCNEVLVVAPNSPSMTTAQNLLPNDSATISGATSTAGGTVTFSLFSPADATCSSQPFYTQQVTVSGSGTYATTNTTKHVTTVGEWRWQVIYSGDKNNVGTTSSCGVENFTITNG